MALGNSPCRPDTYALRNPARRGTNEYDWMLPYSSEWSPRTVSWPDKASKANGGGPLQI